MYAAEHGGAFPAINQDGLGNAARTEGAFVSQLTQFTDFNGNAGAVRGYPYIYGPYIARGIPPAPIGAFQGSSSVKIVTTGPQRASSGNYGWVYNVLNGEIILNTTAAEAAEIQTKFGLPEGDIDGSIGGGAQAQF